jgi:hypothetical protein
VHNTFTEAIVAGITPLPATRPIRLQIEYSTGQTLILEEDALRVWWGEYITLYTVMMQREQGPTFSADSVREAFAKSFGKKEKSGEEED